MPTIDLPFYSQVTAGALRFKNDCGPALVRSFYGKHLLDNGYPDPRETITIDTFAGPAMRGVDKTLVTRDLKNLGDQWGMNLIQTDGSELKPARIKKEIDEGNPMIAVVIYKWLPTINVDYDPNFGHYIGLVGYEAENEVITHYYYNDPLGKTEAQGKNLIARAVDMEKALNPGQNNYFSVMWQGLFYRPTRL